MATVLSADVLFQDPEGAVRGHDEVDAKVAALLGVLTWSVGPEDGTAVVTGTDIARVEDGLIVRLHTLLDEPGDGPA